MKIDLLDMICCPLCKEDLDLFIFEWDLDSEILTKEEKEKIKNIIGSFTDISRTLKKIVTSEKLLNLEVKTGILYCKNCLRWYPIGNLIPTVPELYYPDSLRSKPKEIIFLKKWQQIIPKHILHKGKPWNIQNSSKE